MSNQAAGISASSPTAGYEATLELAASGFVRLYPGLWEMEPGG